MAWGGRWERGSGWGTPVNPWLIHVNVWKKPLQYCKVISLQLIKIIGEKKRDAKGKGESERYTYLNAEFQRIARRDEKACLSDQCKEIEGNNRIGKTRDLFKKIMRWMKLEPIIQSEVSHKEKHQYSILMHIYGI